MPRVHFAAHDVSATSPAQPRLGAWMRELAQRGWETVLWTAVEPGPWTERPNIQVRLVPDPVLRLYRLSRPAPSGSAAGSSEGAEPRSSWARRIGQSVQQRLLFPDNERVWSNRVRRRLLADVRRGDAVVTCSRPESVGAIGAATKARGATWWFDFADGWCYQGLRPQAMTDGPRRQRELALEREQVRAADVVSTVNADLARYFASLRGNDDIVVFPNVIPEEFADIPKRPARAATIPRLAYFGRLSLSDPNRSLRPLLALLAHSEATELRFLFRGEDGAQDRVELAELAGLGHEVEILPPVPRGELRRDAAECDGALFVSSPGQLGTSSKLLDLLGLRLPVFAITDLASAAATILETTGCGECAPLDDSMRAAELLRQFLAGLAAGRYRCEAARLAPYGSAQHIRGLCDRLKRLSTQSSG